MSDLLREYKQLRATIGECQERRIAFIRSGLDNSKESQANDAREDEALTILGLRFPLVYESDLERLP